MKWITRSHVHVRPGGVPLVNQQVHRLGGGVSFVPKTQVLERAAKEGAIAFDTPGAELHHEGELCTFDVIIRKFGLTDPALLRMAKVINAADTDRLDKDPLAAGLEAIAVGYGLRFPNDPENLKRQFEVYDALYAWCRLDVLKSAG